MVEVYPMVDGIFSPNRQNQHVDDWRVIPHLKADA